MSIIADSEYAFSVQLPVDGDTWYANTDWRNVAPADVENLWLATGPHPVLFRAFVDTLTEPVEINFYENAESDAPNALINQAQRRGTTDTTAVVVEENGTITDLGDQLVIGCVTVGASPDPLMEFYLEANTQYLMTIENAGAGNTNIFARFTWVG